MDTCNLFGSVHESLAEKSSLNVELQNSILFLNVIFILGDRHPSNLLLDRMSGKILHIDFGDCFEVAMTREKFPEKIPFRLTRMLINAMEVTGIEGTYR